MIAGNYKDEQGRTVIFEESGKAIWPDKTFKYVVGLDCYWTNSKFDYFEVTGYKYKGIYPMRYGFEWRGNTLCIYEIANVNQDTTVERKTKPLHVLTPQK